MATHAMVLARAPAPTVASQPSFRALGDRPRVELAGVLIDQLDLAAAVQHIRTFLTSDCPHQIVTVNLDFLCIAHRDSRFLDTINGADLAVADGMPLVWASRIKGEALQQRITGNELVAECAQLAAESRQGVFLLGGEPGVASMAGATLLERYPGLRVVGTYTPPFGPLSDAENERILAEVSRAHPGMLFVALGAPRQDLWIRRNLGCLEVPVSMGVGCVLDVLARRVRRAPGWMQHSGLEWAFRLGQEPGRLWRRYLLDDVPMFASLVLDALQQEREMARSNAQTVEGPYP